MHVQTSSQQKSFSVAEYAAALDKGGTRTLPGSGASFWVSYETGGILRMPTFYSAVPAPDEARRILWRGQAAVASYIVEADEHHPANTWLYTCHNRNYSIEELSKPAQRCLRRAQRSLHIAPIELPTLLDHGFHAYHETRTRVRLSDGTREQFERRFQLFSQNPAHQFVGAWKDDALVAFMTLIVVDDWVEIPGSFSTSAHRDLRPNDGLVNYVLDHFLVRHGFRIVSYGLSSVQEDADLVGLHAFKKKVGFEARPVHRAFVLHPLLRPFANRLVLWGTQTALRVYPKARLLRKAGGVLADVLSQTAILRPKALTE